MKKLLIVAMLIISVCGYAKKIEINLTESGTLSEYTTSDDAKSADSLIITGNVELSEKDFLAIKKLLVSYNLSYVDIYETSNIYIDGQPFYGCGNLVGFRFPKGLKSTSRYGFEYCTKLKDVYFPESLESIGVGTFRSCAINKVTIPKNVTSLDSQAFWYCPLTDIYCEPTTPPICNVSAFIAGGGSIDSAILHIPSGTKTLYENADGWMYFTNIVETNSNVHKVSVSNSGNGSIKVNGSLVNNTYVNIEEGSSVTFDFIPDNGYEVGYVSKNDIEVTGSVTNNKYTVESVVGDVSIYVRFDKKQCNVTIKCADNGIIKHLVDYGSKQTYQFIPSEGWILNSVSFDGYDITSSLNDNKYTTPSITSDVELVVIYKSESGDVGIRSANSTEEIKVNAYSNGVVITNEGTEKIVNVYNANGSFVTSKEIGKGSTQITLEKNTVYIIRVGDLSYKILL